jgi:hypothetical protein
MLFMIDINMPLTVSYPHETMPAELQRRRLRRTWFVDLRQFSGVLQPTHLEKALYGCDVSTYHKY